MIIVWLAALGATIVTGLLVGLAYLTARGTRLAPRSVARWAVVLWVANLVFDLVVLYFGTPALTGPYWGGQWLLWPLLLSGVLALSGGSLARLRGALDVLSEEMTAGTAFANGRTRVRGLRAGRGGRAKVVDAKHTPGGAPHTSGIAGAIAIALVFVIAIGVNGLIAIGTTWFDANAKALAAIPRITTEPASAQLPPTDINHMVLVSHGTAAFLGQQVLAANGQNLGSTYHTDLHDYTLQSVRGHLYYIAPLVYNNVFANLGHWESPGYVAVDAENPDVQPVLHTGYHLRYLPGAVLNQELIRHVYLSGYTNGILADPTLEVDDSWKPYYTISLMQPSRGFTGEVVKSVLLVDPQTGGIMEYAPDKVPSWVDRIIPADTVTDYLTWWGKYEHAPWLNLSGSGQQVPAVDQNDQPVLLYDTVDAPVWLVPMTSSASSDTSSTGVVLFDTRDNTGRFYPLAGIGVTSTVNELFKSSPNNIRDYDVANVQLYQIYGEPTWVCSFVHQNDYGESFQGIGLVDAKHLNGANVIFRATKADALAAYAQWLADNGSAAPVTPTGKSVTTQGTVTRINAAVQNGTSVYYFQLQGDSRIFEAGLPISAELPLVQPGYVVRITYLDTGQSEVSVTSFSVVSPPLFGALAPGAGTGTPSATP